VGFTPVTPPNRARQRYERYRANHPEYQSEQRTRQRTIAYRRQRNMSGHRKRPFAAVDGEGGGRGVNHELYVLRAGEYELFTEKPLGTFQCLKFLADLPREFRYLSYFFGYDVGMILKDCPKETLNEIRDRDSRKIWEDKGVYRPVTVGEFEVDCVPRKEFRVRYRGYFKHRTGKKSEWIKPSTWLVIDDLQGYFQSSFLTALVKWDIGTVEERSFIERMKDVRADFGDADEWTEIRAYNALECRLTVELADKLREVCSDLGYNQSRYQGAGHLAGAMLRIHGDKRFTGSKPPSEVAYGAACAYFGGRFEVSRVGCINQKVYEYDIQSAYPTAMLHLPCFCDGKWINLGTRFISDPSVTALYKLQWEPQNRVNPFGFAPFQFRTHTGRTLAPMYGVGWQWHHEMMKHLELGRAHYRMKILDGWGWQQRCSHEPFDWIPPLFDARVALGKSDKGRVLKLGMNSLYGKTAQTVGAGPFANRVWAGLITAWTRAQLLDVYYRLKPSDVVMMATDGIYTLSPVDGLDLTPNKLGAWECVEFDSLFIVQPGFYFDPDGVAKVKTRGIPYKKVVDALSDFMDAWEKDGINGCVRFDQDFFVGVSVAALRGEDWPIGTWKQVTKDVRFRPHKRLVLKGMTHPFNGESYIRLGVPIRIDGESESHAYRRDLFMQSRVWDDAVIADAPDFGPIINLQEYNEWVRAALPNIGTV
jgi:hypothetical protein